MCLHVCVSACACVWLAVCGLCKQYVQLLFSYEVKTMRERGVSLAPPWHKVSASKLALCPWSPLLLAEAQWQCQCLRIPSVHLAHYTALSHSSTPTNSERECVCVRAYLRERVSVCASKALCTSMYLRYNPHVWTVPRPSQGCLESLMCSRECSEWMEDIACIKTQRPLETVGVLRE